MKKLCLKGANVLISLLFVAVLGTSCMNEELDMSEKDLNLEVTPFREGIVLPIGQTEQIKLKDLLKDVDQEILNSVNGAYAVNISGSENFDEQLKSITELIPVIDAVDLSKDMTIELGDLDVSKIKVEAKTFGYATSISDKISSPVINIPSMMPQIPPVKAGLSDFLIDESALTFNMPPLDMSKEPLIALEGNIPPFIGKDDIDITPYLDFFAPNLTFKDSGTYNEVLHLELPEGISHVGEIKFADDAVVKVTLELENSFLKSGTLRPVVKMDMHKILHLEDVDGTDDDIVDLSKVLELNKDNGYKDSAEVKLLSLNVDESDWRHVDPDDPHSKMVLDKPMNFAYDGYIQCENLVTNRALLNESRSTNLVFRVESVDLSIKDVELGIDDIKIEKTESVDLDMDFLMPEQVDAVENVVFTDDSGLELSLKALNLDKFAELNADVYVKLELPEELDVEGAKINTATGRKELNIPYKKADLIAGTVKNVKVVGVDLPDMVVTPDGKKRVVFNDKVDVKVTAVAGGTLHSAELQELVNAGKDVEFTVNAKSEIELADYDVTINGSDYRVDYTGEEIKEEVPAEVAELERIDITLKNDPVIDVNIYLPEIEGLTLSLSDEDLILSFPHMIRFKNLNLPEGCYHDFSDTKNNIVVRKGYPVPRSLRLPIDKLVVIPEKEGEKWYISGTVDVTGSVTLEGHLTKHVVENFTTADYKVGVEAVIPDLIPETVSLDYVASIDEKVDFNVIDKLPAELVELGLIELKENTVIALALDASQLPSLGSSKLLVDAEVKLPGFLKLYDKNGKEYKNNIIKISEQLEDNRLEIDDIVIRALDFSNPDDWKNGIKGAVEVNGSVKLQDAELDIDQWLNPDKPLKVGIDAGIKTIREDGSAKYIDIAKVTGKVDYKLPTEGEGASGEQEISLEEVHKLIGDSGAEAVLDFNYASLALDLYTNIGVPVKGGVQILPYNENGELLEDLVINAPLSLNASESAAEEVATKIWLSNSKDRCPDPTHYNFVNADIVGLIRALPHKLVLKFDAGTDKDKECVFEPMEKYTLRVDYKFNLPLEFGEDFNVTYKYVLEGMPEILGTVLADGNKVQLRGTITNSLPLGLDLQFNFLDSNNKPIEAAKDCGKQYISPCESKGTPSVTKLEAMLGLDPEADLSDIKSLELLFVVTTSEQSAGVPVDEDAFLQADLQIAIPEGVTIDIKDLMDNENE